MVADERFGEGAVEAFDFGVLFGRARIRVEVDDAFPVEGRIEVVGELGAVVGLHMGQCERCDGLEGTEELCGRLGAMRGEGICESELALHVKRGENVPLRAVHEPYDGVCPRGPSRVMDATQFLLVYPRTLQDVELPHASSLSRSLKCF